MKLTFNFKLDSSWVVPTVSWSSVIYSIVEKGDINSPVSHFAPLESKLTKSQRNFCSLPTCSSEKLIMRASEYVPCLQSSDYIKATKIQAQQKC